MAYVSKARRKQPELREPVPGNGTSLVPGKTHKVRVDHVGSADNALIVVFKDSFDEAHVERVFRMNKDGDDLSGLLKQLIAATARDSSELKDWYDALANGDEQVEALLVGRNCTIDTEYRGDYVNIKTIRSGNDRDNGGGFFQSVEANPTHKERAADTGQPKQYLPVSDTAASFF